MDEIRLIDSEPFADLVVGRPNIKHLFFGHLHRPLSGSWRGIPFSNVLGTNHQVELSFTKVGLVPVATSHRPTASCSPSPVSRWCIYTTSSTRPRPSISE